MGFLRISFFLFLALILRQSAAQMDGTFQCSSGSTCRALIGYSPSKDTTLAALQTLFSIGNLKSLLGANNLPPATKSNFPISANNTIRVPIPCACANGTGVSNRVPFYTVRANDTMSTIATDFFRGMVQYPAIGKVNNITNLDEIFVGQKLWIPLPCSCDQVDGQEVLHYTHMVAPGSTVAGIAAEFGSDAAAIIRINGMNDSRQLLADYPLDVPLKVCNSSVKKDSLDYPLLVSNASYILTANNCIRCNCEASNNFTLLCLPSQLNPLNWATCPSARCEGQGSLSLSNRTTSGCNRTSCVYSGFNNQTIQTSLVTESTCPGSSPPGSSPPGLSPPASAPGNSASSVLSSWYVLLIMSVQLVVILLRLH